jgi:LysR family glycine cleavage system transcriptional activator
MELSDVPPFATAERLKAFRGAARSESLRARARVVCQECEPADQGVGGHVGIKLFIRERQRLVTQAVAILAARDALDELRWVRSCLCQRQTYGVLTSALAGFCCQWFVIGSAGCRGSSRHDPEVANDHVDFAREDVDLAVRHGDGNGLGWRLRPYSEQLFPVCSPSSFLGAPHNEVGFVEISATASR